MNRMIWLSITALAAMLLFAGCRLRTEQDTDDIDGGVIIDTSYDAPKEIKSTEMKSFYCQFSNYGLFNEDTYLENRIYTFEAALKNDIVQGSYQIHGRGETMKENFETEPEFLKDVQKIVKEHYLAENNGHSYKVSGLPEQYGAVLEVEYESGEHIYASDNQHNFFSIETMEALEKLFRKQFEEVGKDDEVPKILDLTVSKQFSMENTNGRYVTLEYPVLELGYEKPDGEWLNTEGYPALEKALTAYNKEEQEFHEGSRSTLRSAAKTIEGDEEEYRELYTYTDAYVTRNDTRVLSFYTFTRHYEGWIHELFDWETRNFDVQSGRILTFEDVFTDLEDLACIVATELKAAYSDLQFPGNLDQLIAAGMEENEGILFALSYDCVHIFAENQYLSNEDPKGQHIGLSYFEYPEIVKEAYRTSAKNWMVNLDFNRRDPLIQELYSQLDLEYAPDCYQICIEGQKYIYLRIPAGDVTLLTYIYEVTEEGVLFRGQVKGAMHQEVNFNPECMKMYGSIDFDQLEVGETIPFDLYTVGEGGLPIKLEMNYR